MSVQVLVIFVCLFISVIDNLTEPIKKNKLAWNFSSIQKKKKYKCLQYVINQIVNMRLRIGLSVPQRERDRLIYISIFPVILNLKMLWLLVLFFSVSVRSSFFFFLYLWKQCSLNFETINQQDSSLTFFLIHRHSSVFVILYLLTTSPYTEPCMCRTES